MSGFLFLGALFLLLPFPICIYLLIKRSKDARRIQLLEQRMDSLSASQEPSKQASSVSKPTKAPAPSPEQSRAPSGAPTPFTQCVVGPEPPRKPQPAQTFTTPASKPAPKAAAVVSPETAPKPATPSQLVETLRSIGLWPPKGSASAEAGLMQWWLPRLGGLLATLAVISFAVYISQGTPAWIRFVELVLADIAVLGAGIFFLNRRPRFGSTLLSTGLSMLYLTSIAAYAAPPVRIIDNPLIGIVLQFAIVAFIFTTSLRLSNRNIAIMALAYGFLSSLYSSYVGLLESSLISALALYLIGIAFSRKFDWLPILSISTIGAYLPVLSFCLLEFIGSQTITLPHAWSVLAYLLISVSLLPLSEAIWKLFAEKSAIRRIHLLNTSFFLAVGYLYMKLFTSELVAFYGLGAIVFTAWAGWFSRNGPKDFLFQLFLIKAGALTALWLVNRFDGDIRWFALIIEAGLLAWVAARSRSFLQETATLIVWIVSLGYAMNSLDQSRLEIGSFAWTLFLLHPLAATALLAFLHQTRISDGRNTRYYILPALFNGLIASVFVLETQVAKDVLPLITALFGAILCLLSLVPKLSRLVPFACGVIPILAANIQFWISPYDEMSFVAVLAATLALAWATSQVKLRGKQILLPLVEFVFHFSWITTVYAYAANAFQTEAYFAYLPALFALALLVTPVSSFRALRDASFVPLFLFAITHPQSPFGFFGNLLAVGLYLAVLYTPNFRPRLIRDFKLFRRWKFWRTLHHWLVALIVFRAALNVEDWLERVFTLSLLAIAFHFLWRLHKRYVALFFSAFFLVGDGILILLIWKSSLEATLIPQPWAKEALIGGLLVTALAIGLGIDHARNPHRRQSKRSRQLLAYLFATIAYGSMVVLLSSDLLWNESSYTSLIALFCLVLIGIGISAKIKPYRMVALIGFTLPLFRLFVFDIRDTLIRIVAFALLSVFITFVGYLYHRFQSRIE
jgi:hypothetical protein